MKTLSGKELEFEIKLSETESETYRMPELSALDELQMDEYLMVIFENQPLENERDTKYIERILGSKKDMIEFIEFGQRLVPELRELTMMTAISRFLTILFLFVAKRNELKKK